MTTKSVTKQDNNNRLSEAFGEVGDKYGYKTVIAEFVGTKDFKVKWERQTFWAKFKVSDYLEDAPWDVLTDLADVLFKKISGQCVGYTDRIKEYLFTDDFIGKYQPVYLKRCRSLSKTPQGDHRDLGAVLAGLVEEGLIPEDKQLVVGWSSYHFESAIFKTIGIPKCLDSDDTPDSVLEYVVLSRVLGVTERRKTWGTGSETTGFELADRLYPEVGEAHDWMRDHFNGY